MVALTAGCFLLVAPLPCEAVCNDQGHSHWFDKIGIYDRFHFSSNDSSNGM
jgi:hypothetical protein